MAAPADCPRLVIPWKNPQDQDDPEKMQENWLTLERWADALLKCMCDCVHGS